MRLICKVHDYFLKNSLAFSKSLEARAYHTGFLMKNMKAG